MAESNAFRAPKPWQLSEHETVSSFANWKSNILYNLSLNNEFAPFLDSTWSKKTVANRGLADLKEGEVVKKTAVQLAIVLERMLGLVAQFVPTLLRSEIIKRSTSLAWIWNRLRKHYSFNASEVNFLRLSEIKIEEGERYETFFQRIMAHIEDNLLTVNSGLQFDGEDVGSDEELSPTAERLGVYLWLTKIDERLPAFVGRIYAHDLQTKSLKDIQPQLAASMESLLTDLAVQDEVKVNFSRTRRDHKSDSSRSFNQFRNKTKSMPGNSKSTQKTCLICKNAGRNHSSHDTSDCWYISKFEKLQLSKALRVETDDFDDGLDAEDQRAYSVESVEADNSSHEATKASSDEVSFNRVDCAVSPFFYAFYQHLPVHITIDSGATSSMISKSFVTRAGIKISPTGHSARGISKTTLNIHGEVHITLNYEDKSLPLTALVIDNDDCDILVGVPFCTQNEVVPLMSKRQVMIGESVYHYGNSAKRPSVHKVYMVDSFLIRNKSAKVVLPGDYLEYSSEDLGSFNGEVLIEPHSDSPLKGIWPAPT